MVGFFLSISHNFISPFPPSFVYLLGDLKLFEDAGSPLLPQGMDGWIRFSVVDSGKHDLYGCLYFRVSERGNKGIFDAGTMRFIIFPKISTMSADRLCLFRDGVIIM